VSPFGQHGRMGGGGGSKRTAKPSAKRSGAKGEKVQTVGREKAGVQKNLLLDGRSRRPSP